jgi:hypothetical protein
MRIGNAAFNIHWTRRNPYPDPDHGVTNPKRKKGWNDEKREAGETHH